MKIYIWTLKVLINYLRFLAFTIFLGNSMTGITYEGDSEKSRNTVDSFVNKELSKLNNNTDSIRLGYSFDPSSYYYNINVNMRTSKAITKETFSLEETSETIKNVLLALNNVPCARPYISDFPVGIKNLGFTIFYEEKPYQIRLYPYLSLLDNYHTSILHIEIREKEPNPCMVGPWRLVEKLKLEVPKQYIPPEGGWATPRKFEKTKNTTPIYRGREAIKDVAPSAEQQIFPQVFELGQSLGLNFAVLGEANEKTFTIGTIIGTGYWAQKKIELEEAKKLAHTVFHKFFSIVFNNYDLWCRSKGFRRHPDCKDMKDEQFITFRISFWDEFLNRVEAPYIAQIQCENGKIIYYAADEGQRLYKVFEEEAPKAILQESLVDKFKKLFWKPEY